MAIRARHYPTPGAHGMVSPRLESFLPKHQNPKTTIPMNAASQLHASTSLEASTTNPIRTLVSGLTRTDGSVAPALLRLTLAAVVFPHGAQKLLGWFGGYGFTGTMGFFTGTMGIPWLLAFGVIMIEFFGALLLLVGAGTRLAALGIGTVMTTAMFMVHVKNGFFMNWAGKQQGEGIEYFLLILGLALALIVSGGGRWSVDRAINKN
jgi:putative oxidoreductase